MTRTRSYSRGQKRRRGSASNDSTICSSLLLVLLLFMGLMTVILNLVYIRHYYYYKKKRKQHSLRSTQLSYDAHNFNLTSKGGHQAAHYDKQGQVLHQEIHNVTVDSLVGLHDDALTVPYNESISPEQAKMGKEPLLQLLEEAGVTNIDVEVLQKLPLFNTIQDLYGPGPVLVGTETCQAFRESVPKEEASLGVAGMFNTGTNLMALYLEANCKMPFSKNRKNHGIRWQVPWGKHILASLKWINTAGHEERTDKSTVLPIVIVRDPYSWMESMCRNHYGARWHYTKDHCPNLVPNEEDYKLFPYSGKNIPVRLDYGGDHSLPITSYDSLAHLWSEWYRQYVEDADYPRLIVRYEDLMYYPKQLIPQVCACAGGVPMEDEFTYLVDSAKWGPGHGREETRTSLITAMIKYGNAEKRLRGYTDEDLQLAHVGLSEDLMNLFQYNRPLEHDVRKASSRVKW